MTRAHWQEEFVEKIIIALAFSGHTFGMQTGINFEKKHWSQIKYKFKHRAGLYKQNNQYLYVNRGLGWWVFPGGFVMRPKTTFLQIKCNVSN